MTGNPEPIARARTERLSIGRFLRPGQGAFGCEEERRTDLIQLARERASGWPAERTVAVGDTPLDVESAHAARIRCVAVTSDSFGREELGAADAVLDRFAELPAALARLEAL